MRRSLCFYASGKKVRKLDSLFGSTTAHLQSYLLCVTIIKYRKIYIFFLKKENKSHLPTLQEQLEAELINIRQVS